MSEKKIVNNSNNLIVCFGGIKLNMGGILPFEFLNFLTETYKGDVFDKYFYIDKHQCGYHRGISGISHNIDDTAKYLNNIIAKGNYQKVLFMGHSGGGYGAILFGSLCNVTNVIAFQPRTYYPQNQITKKMMDLFDKKYLDIRRVINNVTKYDLYGNLSVTDIYSNHHISQCEYLKNFTNVKIIRLETLNMKKMRDNGELKQIIDKIIS